MIFTASTDVDHNMELDGHFYSFTINRLSCLETQAFTEQRTVLMQYLTHIKASGHANS